MTQAFFVTGTGTDIGKTYITSLLARYTTERNLTTAVMKPAQTGMLDPMQGDLGKVKQAAPGILDLPQLILQFLLDLLQLLMHVHRKPPPWSCVHSKKLSSAKGRELMQLRGTTQIHLAQFICGKASRG